MSKQELKVGLEKFFHRSINDNELNDIFDRVDADGSGSIGYSEFLMATMNDSNLINNEKLRYAFKLFDLDGGGSISINEVRNTLKMINPNIDAEEMFEQLDVNCDGDVSFDEFLEVMQSLR